MIQQTLEQIAQKYKGTFTEETASFSAGANGRYSTSIYRLILTYNGIEILGEFKFGSLDLAKFTCEIPSNNPSFEFNISSLSPFKQFIFRKKNPLIIESSSAYFKKELERSNSLLILEQHARKERFEPEIEGLYHEGKVTIDCRYHLVFNNKELVTEPILNLFFELIDHISQATKII